LITLGAGEFLGRNIRELWGKALLFGMFVKTIEAKIWEDTEEMYYERGRIA